ncbi:MAG: hypothetical protein FJ011_17280 [Chloroflexi bacterium]|nr:hypothetical protein [Chloroflexota bacterium]
METHPNERTALPPAQRRSPAPDALAAEPQSAAPPRRQSGGSLRRAHEAARAVMHPDWHDPEWRYYHGAWGG